MERKCYICGRTLDKNGLCPKCSQDGPTQILRRPAPQKIPTQQRPQSYQRPQAQHTPQAYNIYNRPTAPQCATKPQTVSTQTSNKSANIVLITSCCIAAIVLTLLFIALGAELVSAKDSDASHSDTTTISATEIFSESISLPTPKRRESYEPMYCETETYSKYYNYTYDYNTPTETTHKKTETTTKKQTTKPSSKKSDAEIYKTWLLNGGYEEITYFEDSSDLEIRSCLVDADSDGRKELLIEITDTSSYNVRGHAASYAYLDIKNDSPVIVKTASFCGGSAGGSRLSFLLDDHTGKYVLALHESSRDGVFAYADLTEIYTISHCKVNEKINYMTMSMDESNPTYAVEANEVKEETNFYFYDESGRFTYCKINGNYASEDSYNCTSIMFLEPSNFAYQLKDASYSNPIA